MLQSNSATLPKEVQELYDEQSAQEQASIHDENKKQFETRATIPNWEWQSKKIEYPHSSQ